MARLLTIGGAENMALGVPCRVSRAASACTLRATLLGGHVHRHRAGTLLEAAICPGSRVRRAIGGLERASSVRFVVSPFTVKPAAVRPCQHASAVGLAISPFA